MKYICVIIYSAMFPPFRIVLFYKIYQESGNECTITWANSNSMSNNFCWINSSISLIDALPIWFVITEEMFKKFTRKKTKFLSAKYQSLNLLLLNSWPFLITKGKYLKPFIFNHLFSSFLSIHVFENIPNDSQNPTRSHPVFASFWSTNVVEDFWSALDFLRKINENKPKPARKSVRVN